MEIRAFMGFYKIEYIIVRCDISDNRIHRLSQYTKMYLYTYRLLILAYVSNFYESQCFSLYLASYWAATQWWVSILYAIYYNLKGVDHP